MIIQNEKPNAQYVGEIKANKVGIDTKNIDFVASLLTTNLYSNPIKSFLRETVSNGWDSHIEAGNPEPVIISLKSENPSQFKDMTSWRYYNGRKETITITIRDFGVGLSPARFASIYTNIGSSTKRESNDFIGCFGIGRFSCLSCTDSAVLDSYYNGIRYSYLMYKDGSGINIDELGQFPTDAKNGLSVQITLDMDYYKVQDLLGGFEDLAFFNCIYLDDAQRLLGDFAEKFNARQSAYFKNFGIKVMDDYALSGSKYSNENNKVNIVVGNCIYPFTKTSLFTQSDLPKELNIYLHFNIGELDVTPNREAILYNNKTDAIIIQRAKEAVEELKQMIIKQECLDFPSLIDWYKYKKSNQIVLSLPVSENKVFRIPIQTQSIRNWGIPETCTIKGKEIPVGHVYSFTQKILDTSIPHSIIRFRYEKSSDMLYTKMLSYSSVKLLDAIGDNNIITTDARIWKAALKDYVKAHCFSTLSARKSGYIIDAQKAVVFLKSVLRELIEADNSKNHACLKFVLKELDFKNLLPNHNNETIPEDYLKTWEANKKAQQAKTTDSAENTQSRKCVIYTLNDSQQYDWRYSGYGTTVDTRLYTKETIATSGKLFVYTSNDNIELLKRCYVIFGQKLGLYVSTEFIYVAPSNIPIIASLPNTVDLFEYLYSRKNTTIADYTDLDYNIVKLFKETRSIGVGFDSLIQEFPDIHNKVEEYKAAYSKCGKLNEMYHQDYKSLIEELCTKYKEKGWTNPRIKEIQSDQKLITFLKWVKQIRYSEDSLAVFTDYIYRSGISTISTKALNAYKNSEFYKSFLNLNKNEHSKN